MHPFYGPSARLLGERARDRATTASGLISMAAYLAFWAAALLVAKRELDARLPRASRAGRVPGSASPVTQPTDAALSILRERFARGEIDEAQFRAMAAVLADVTDTPG